MSDTRISAAQLACVARQLSDRDRAIVSTLARVKLATGNQLRRIVVGDDAPAAKRATRRQLARLVEWRVVTRLERRQGGLGRGSDAWTYALDVVGLRLLEQRRARRPRVPSRPMWAHALAGAEVFTRLVEASRETERHVGLWQGEPDSWRTFAGPFGERVVLKPDAFVVVVATGYEDAYFIEVDMGTQGRSILRRKVRAYSNYARTGQEQERRDGIFPLTLFVVPDDARRNLVELVIAELPPRERPLFAVATVDEAADVLSGVQS